MTQDDAKRPSDTNDEQPAEAESAESLQREIFAGLRRIADKVGVHAVREALRQSILITSNADHRSAYDSLREDLDAYLGAARESDVEVRTPEAFRPSPAPSEPGDTSSSAETRRERDV